MKPQHSSSRDNLYAMNDDPFYPTELVVCASFRVQRMLKQHLLDFASAQVSIDRRIHNRPSKSSLDCRPDAAQINDCGLC